MTLVVVGDFDSKKTFEKIKAAYEKIPSRPQPKLVVQEVENLGLEKKVTLYERVTSTSLQQAYRICQAGHPDAYALDVLANILFNGKFSRVHQKLVEKEKIAIGINGLAFTPVYPGLFFFTAALKKGVSPTQAEKSFYEILQNLQTHEVKEEELSKAKQQLILDMVDQVKSPHGLAQMLGLVETVLGDYREIHNDIERYLEVTPQKVKEVVNRYLIPNNRVTLHLFPEEERKEEP